MRDPLVALAVTAERAAEELALELSPDDVQAVRAWMTAEGEASVTAWLLQHAAEVEKMARSTASKRRTLAGRDETRRRRLVYFAAAGLVSGARVARELARVHLPEVASLDRSLVGTVFSLTEFVYRAHHELEAAASCWDAWGDWAGS